MKMKNDAAVASDMIAEAVTVSTRSRSTMRAANKANTQPDAGMKASRPAATSSRMLYGLWPILLFALASTAILMVGRHISAENSRIDARRFVTRAGTRASAVALHRAPDTIVESTYSARALEGVGEGCSFQYCNTAPPPTGTVIGGRSALPFAPTLEVPYVYVVVAHRNRLQNLHRLLRSISTALEGHDWIRHCVCAVVVDFNTTLEDIHPDQYAGLRMPPELLNLDVELKPEVDRNREIVRHVLRQYTGESHLLDGRLMTKFWAKAALLQGALDQIRTPSTKSIMFVCDADLVITSADFFKTLLSSTIRSQQVFVPVLWSTCFDKGLDKVPTSPKQPDNENGFWRISGTGMVAVFKSDVERIGGYRIKDMQRVRYGEEDINFTRDLATTFRLHRPNMPSLVHLYHSRVEWTKGTSDGIHLNGITNFCTRQGTCLCPPGTTLAEIEAQLLAEQRMKAMEVKGLLLANAGAPAAPPLNPGEEHGRVGGDAPLDAAEMLAMPEDEFEELVKTRLDEVQRALRHAAALQLSAEQRRTLRARKARAGAGTDHDQ